MYIVHSGYAVSGVGYFCPNVSVCYHCLNVQIANSIPNLNPDPYPVIISNFLRIFTQCLQRENDREQTSRAKCPNAAANVVAWELPLKQSCYAYEIRIRPFLKAFTIHSAVIGKAAHVFPTYTCARMY